MAQGSRVLRIDGGRRARRDLDRLLAAAKSEIVAAEAGDLAAVYHAHRALNRAVGLLLKHRWDAA